jgi:apolipoprotein N-acyltransferase
MAWDNRVVIPIVIGAAAGVVLFFAFPPIEQGFLAIPAMTLFLWGLRRSETVREAARAGAAFGLVFFGLLFPWLTELGFEAFLPLWLVQSLFPTAFAWWVWRTRGLGGWRWAVTTTGGWALLEAIRIRFPLGGFEWGVLGYPMGAYGSTRGAAQWIGTSGWSVVAIASAAVLVVAVIDRRYSLVAIPLVAIGALVLGGTLSPAAPEGPTIRVAAIQGSTPCPGTHCADERLRTWQTHLELTRRIEPGSVDLVVWPEGSSGGFAADPVLIPEVREAMGAEARRLGTVLIAGGDRPISDTEWINANVVFDQSGQIIGEYRKRHPVPFGEYIPARPLFDWIPALSAIPRDMVPGEDPVVFDVTWGKLGSVGSWEGSFSRFARDEVAAGAQTLVVATNQGSYPYSYASDQFIGMTRMRAAELGVDVVHAGVVGRSTIITDGGVVGDVTGQATSEVLFGEVQLRTTGPTLFTRLGNWVQWAAIVVGLAIALPRLRAQREPRPGAPGG